jgi:hypothetical protein
MTKPVTIGQLNNVGGAVFQISTALSAAASITPASINGAVNDYNPTGLVTTSTIYQNLTADATLSGLNSTGFIDGQIVWITNISTSFNINLVHQTLSAAANQFTLANSELTPIPPGATIGVKYSTATSKFIPLGAAVTKMPFFNVRSYGATGGGIVDDTIAVNNAGAAAFAAGGGTVYFPNGTYLVSEYLGAFQTIKMMTGVSWLGQSREGVVIITAANQRASVRGFSNQAGTAISDFIIENLTYDGNKINQSIPDNNHRDDVFLNNCQRVTVRNVELRNGTGSGIVFFQNSTDCIVNNVYIHDNKWMGISWGDAGTDHRSSVRDFYITNNAGGLHVECSQLDGEIIIDHGYVDSTPGNWAVQFAGSNNASGIDFVVNGWMRDVFVNGGVLVNNAANIVVDSCSINCSDSAITEQMPIEISGNVQDVWFSRCQVILADTATSPQAVLIAGNQSGQASDNLCVSDCSIYVNSTTAHGIVMQASGTARAERNRVFAIGATAWQANTVYAESVFYNNATRVTNGGNVYQVIAGTSAGAGGPTGTGSGIVDNTVVWNYVGAGSTGSLWAPNTVYALGTTSTPTEVHNGGNVYQVAPGTSAGSGGPTGTGSSITDNTVVWEFVGVASTTQYGIFLDLSVARNMDTAIIRGNECTDFNIGVATASVGGGTLCNYADISANTFHAVTAGVMTACISWEIDGRTSVTIPVAVDNVCSDSTIPMFGGGVSTNFGYPHAPLQIGGNGNDIAIYSYASAPAVAAPIGSVAIVRGAGTAFINQTGLSGGWQQLLTTTAGIGQVLGQGPYSSNWQHGRWYAAPNFGSVSTSITLNNGALRATPFWVPNAVTVQAIACEVTTGGGAGALYRAGIYADDGTGRPGALLLDAGTFSVAAGDPGVPGVLTITGLSTALTPGVYWIAGVVQGNPAPQPTLRTITPAGIMPNIDFGTSTPTAAEITAGVNATGSQTGALPNPFVYSSVSSAAPRIYIQV